MEINVSDIHTAEDLFNLLERIPPAQRERLPISFMTADGMDGFDGPFTIEAYEVIETEGEIERGFRLSPQEES